ncbi:MAG TPA: hypothetical protein VMT86_14435 [Bryobacteraceae bacterium]|nr:hypothetical protein [Bryobacteraceae bacterium]
MMPAGSFARSQARRIPLLAAIPALVFLVYWCARLAWADHLAHAAVPETVARGVRLAPGDAAYRLKLAEVQAAAGADPAAALTSAVALDPTNAMAWIRLGVTAEMRGDPHSAERDLLKAAEVSRQFAPRWALANFYFRRGDRPHFWTWARASLQISYGDLNPIFRLCWNMSQDSRLIFERAIPQRRDVLDAYVRFLSDTGRLAAAEPVAVQLAGMARPEDVPALVAWCNRQIDAGLDGAAVGVWNQLCARRLLPYAPVDRDLAPVTDGNFAAVSSAIGGFAWRVPPVPGVTWGTSPNPSYLWLTFSGDQPENCEPLTQFAPVIPGAGYKLRFEYQTSQDIPATSGLRWSAYDARTGAALASSSGWLANPDWKAGEVRFTAPPNGLVRVALSDQRVLGSTRIEGTLELRGVSMERLP